MQSPRRIGSHGKPKNCWNVGRAKDLRFCRLFSFVTKSSKGSMVAIERPWIVCELQSDNCTVSGLGFEYKSNTRLYTVPYVPVGDQVFFPSTALYPFCLWMILPLLTSAHFREFRLLFKLKATAAIAELSIIFRRWIVSSVSYRIRFSKFSALFI